MGRFPNIAGFPIITVLSLLLSGCAQFPQWPLFAQAAPKETGPAHYDFGWRLSGDRAVAPMQVFDDGRQMWLQFAANAPVPAIFSRSRQGDTPLSYERNGPYVVVQGVWPALVLRGGRLQSLVERIAAAPGVAPQAKPASAPESGPGSPGSPLAATLSLPATGPVAESASVPPTPLETGAAAPADDEQPAMPAASVSVRTAAPLMDMAPQPAIAPLPVYDVSPLDQNIRRALMRWADTAGWTFGAAHWTVDIDIPIVGSARFESGFKQAVQALLASTELGGSPLQACFYSNKVLRVVSYAQACDRTANRTNRS